MKARTLTSDLLLLLAALIWGVAFVPQRTAMDDMGPFTFTGIRFALGAMTIAPFLIWWSNGRSRTAATDAKRHALGLWTGGGLTGVFLFIAVNLQQLGMVHTTAGKAGFISGLYVVAVALLGLLWRQFPPLGTWAGVVLAVAGLYLLAVPRDWAVNQGDMLVFLSIFFWAGQVHLIGHLTGHVRVLSLAVVEFGTCAVLSLIVAAFTEPITLQALRGGAWELFYGGLLSAGIGYTLQIAGQKSAPSSHAAIIMSAETVFAGIAGWLFLNELMGPRALVGCALMLAGIILSQLAHRPAQPLAVETPAPRP